MRSADATTVVYEFDGYRLAPGQRALTRSTGSAVPLRRRPFDALVRSSRPAEAP